MKASIEERVTQLELDNTNFETNAKTSLNTIEKLQSALKFNNASDGFEQITTAAGKVNMNPLANACETIANKFTMMDVLAYQVFARISNYAINAAKSLATQFTTAQIGAGWNKYGSMTTSVQTIMSATNKNIGETVRMMNGTETVINNQQEQIAWVQDALDKLNWFTDETSYNLTDMTDNIGKFISAGVDLDVAVNSMQGIATWAGISGANVQQASHAMYNLSQAMGTGAVKLQDWKSIENANMATVEFKQAAIDAAENLGTLKKNADGTYAVFKKLDDGTFTKVANSITLSATNFNDTLKEGWFSADVLNSALNRFGGFATKLSEYYDNFSEKGISTTSELISAIEKYKDAGNDISKKSSIINDAIRGTTVSAEEMKEMLDELSASEYDLGYRAFKASQEAKTFSEAISATSDAVSTAWMNIFQSIFGNYLEAKKIWTDLSNSLWDIFAGPVSALSDEFKSWHEDNGYSTLWEGVYRLLGNVSSVATQLHDAFSELFPSITAERLLEITNKFNDFTKSVDHWLNGSAEEEIKRIETVARKGLNVIEDISNESRIAAPNIDKIRTIFNGIASVFRLVFDAISQVGRVVKELFIYFVEQDWGLLDFIANIATMVIGLKDTADQGEVLVSTADKIIESGKQIIDLIKQIYDSTIGKFIEGFNSKFSETGDAVEETSDKLSIFSIVLSTISDLFSKIGSVISDLFINFKTLGEKIVSYIQPAFEKIKDIIGNLFETIGEIVSNLSLDKIFDALNTAFGGAATGGAFGILYELFRTFQDLSNFIKPIGGVRNSIFDFFESLTDATDKMQTKVKSEAIKNIAISIGILAVSLLILSSIDENAMQTAITGIGSLATIMVLMSLSLSAINKSFSGGNRSKAGLATLELVAISSAVLILCIALKAIANIDPERLWPSIGAVTTLLALMVGTLVVLRKISQMNPGKHAAGVGQLIAIAVALNLLMIPVELMSRMDPDKLALGISGVFFLLVELVGCLELLNRIKTTKNALVNCLTLIVITNQLIKLMIPVELLGHMDGDKMVLGISGVGMLIGELLAAIALLSKVSYKDLASALASAGLMVVISTALIPMVTSAGILAAMSEQKMQQGLAGLGLILSELVAALLIFGKFGTGNASGMLAGSASLIILAGALAIVIPELILLSSIKFSTLLKSIVALTLVIGTLAGISIILSAIAQPILVASGALFALGAALSLVGVGAILLGLGIDSLISVFGVLGSTIYNSKELFVDLAVQIASALPIIIKGLVDSIDVLLDGLIDLTPKLVDAVIVIVMSVLDGLAENIEPMIVAIGKILVDAINGLSIVLPDLITALVNFLYNLFESVIQLFDGFSPESVLKVLGITTALTALIIAIGALAPYVTAALGVIPQLGIAIAELAGVIYVLGALYEMPFVKDMIDSGGMLLESLGTAIGRFVGGIVGGIAAGATSTMPEIATDLSEFGENIQPFIESTKDLNSAALDGVSVLTDIILKMSGANLLNAISSWITGGTDFSAFSDQLVSFGSAMTQFASEIKDVNSDAVLGAGNAGVAIAEMVKTLPKQGGIASWFTGKRDVEGFINSLTSFGSGIKSFGESVIGINLDSINIACDAARAVMNLGNIDGSDALLNWGDSIESFGDSYSSFLNSIGSDDSNIVEALNTSLTNLTTSSAAISESLTSMNTALDSCTTALTNAKNTFYSAGSDLFTAVMEGMQSQTPAVALSVEVMIASVIQKMSSLKVGFKESASAGINEYVRGLNKGITPVKSMAVSLGKSIVTTLGNYKSSFYSIGYLFTKGLADGMNAYSYLVSNAAATMARTAVRTMEQRLDIHSPSRVMAKIGRFTGEGFSNGILDSIGLIKDSASQASESAIDTLRNSLGNITYDMLNDDVNPVITPVLDLSEIQNGSSAISSMLSGIDSATNLAVSGISLPSNSNSIEEKIGNAVNSALDKMVDMYTSNEFNRVTRVEVPLSIDGRQFAKATAEYNRTEINKLDSYSNRRGGTR